MKQKHESNKNPRKVNIILLISTMITAILTGLAVEFFYSSLANRHTDSRLFMPISLGILFASLLAIIALVVFLISKAQLTYRADVITGRNSKSRIILYLLIGIIAITLQMFGSEYLYENTFNFESKLPNTADTYVFLIDDSASMDSNDPNRQRYAVIEEILADKSASTQFTVYSFADSTRQIVPMQTISEGFPNYPVSDEFMTEMKAGLEKVVTDCENKVWTASKNTMLIIITDGAPSDFDLFYEITPVLDRCIAQDMTLGIVGVIGANNSLMRQMASYTGGTFTDISDPMLMKSAVLSVSNSSGRTRDLMSLRNHVNADWLYAMIRIISIAISGAIMAVAAALAYGNNTVFNFIISANTIKAVVAGLILEFGNQLMFDDRVVRLLTLILLGTIISKNGSHEKPVSTNDIYFDFD